LTLRTLPVAGQLSSRNVIGGPTVVDLFAGCGGLSLGLEHAGFTPVFVNELDRDAMGTYLRNRVGSTTGEALSNNFNARDVKTLVANEGGGVRDLAGGLKNTWGIRPGELDLVAGGPPCQGYSGIGHRRSYSVERSQLPSNHLYQDMAYVVSVLRPRMFLFENVRGLLSARWTKAGEKGEIWEDVKAAFQSIPGYRVEPAVVRAADYGVPQNRPRVLMVGIRDDIAWTEDLDAPALGLLPVPSNEKVPDLVDVLGDLVDLEPANWQGGVTERYPQPAAPGIQHDYFRRDRDGNVRRKGSVVTDHEYSNHSPHVRAKFEAMLANDGLIPESMKTKKFAQRLLPRIWGPGGPSITATSLPDDYVHYEQPRTLTVREWARLQTFPDWYEFSGKRTTGGIRRAGNPREGLHERELPKYTQIGNAVPVRLAEAVGKHLRTILGR
jgi:DNA (cytosine-5)-methyltransferase 1